MRLAPRDLEAALARGTVPAPVLLVYGPDAGLVGERVRRLLEVATGGADDPFRVVVLEGERLAREPQRLAEEALALAFDGGGRVVRVREADDRCARAVEGLLAGPPPVATVVLEAGELGPRSRLRRLVEAAKAAAACPCYREEGRDLARTLEGLLSAEGLRAGPGVVEWLTGHLGADHGVTRREIEKLALYVGDRADRTVRLEDVEAVVADATAVGLDRLVQALLAGRVAEVERVLDRLEAAGEAAVTLLRAAARELLRLWRLAAEVEAGTPPRRAVETARPPVFFRLRPLYVAVLARCDRRRLAVLLAALQEAELLCKRTGSPERAVVRRMLGDLARALADGRAEA